MLKAKQSAPEDSMQFLLYKATRRVWTSTADIPPWLADAETDLEPKDSSQRTTTLAFSDVHMAVHRTYQIRQQNMLSSDHSFERRFYVGVKEHHLGFSPNPTFIDRQLSFKNPGTQRWECRACSSTPTTPTQLNFRHQNTAHHHHCWPARCRLPCQPWQVLFHSTPFFPSHPGLTTCSPVFYLLAHCWSDLLLQSKSLKLAAKGHLKMVTSSNIPPHHLTKHRRFCYPALMAAAQFWKGCSMSGNLHLSNHLSTQICTEDSRNKPMSECYQQGRCSQLKNIHRS